MNPMAAIVVGLFGFLIVAPALAAWSLRFRGPISNHVNRILHFPFRHNSQHSKHHKEIDAA